MSPLKGLLQFLIGLIQVMGAVVYIALAITVGLQQQTHILGGFLVVITLLSLAVFGWPGRKES